MEMLPKKLCAGLAACDQVACRIVLLKGEMHKTVAFGCSLDEEARMFSHLAQEFFDLLFNVGIVLVPYEAFQTRPFLAQFAIDLFLGGNACRLMQMYPVGQFSQ